MVKQRKRTQNKPTQGKSPDQPKGFPKVELESTQEPTDPLYTPTILHNQSSLDNFLGKDATSKRILTDQANPKDYAESSWGVIDKYVLSDGSGEKSDIVIKLTFVLMIAIIAVFAYQDNSSGNLNADNWESVWRFIKKCFLPISLMFILLFVFFIVRGTNRLLKRIFLFIRKALLSFYLKVKHR